jgi:hypothetical protein
VRKAESFDMMSVGGSLGWEFGDRVEATEVGQMKRVTCWTFFANEKSEDV